MRKHNIIIQPEALGDLKFIFNKHLELVGKNSAERIIDKIFDKLDSLSFDPNISLTPKYRNIAKKGYRYIICDCYLCFFEVVKNDIMVTRIIDGRWDYQKMF